MKIALLCNGPLAIPSVHLLIEKKSLAGIAVPLIFDPFPFRMQDLATKHRIPFSVIHKKDAEAELEQFIRVVDPDVVFVMLWPSKISAGLLKLPGLGFYNWHPGLLPQYRGPDPVFWEIRNAEPFGAITVHKMNEHLDRGPVAFVDRVPIKSAETDCEHWEKLTASATKATDYMLSGLPAVPLIPQDESIAGYHPSPTEVDRTIDWKNPADSIFALIRASFIYGGAISYFRNAPIHILRASAGAAFPVISEPGSILSTTPFTISCKDNKSIRPEEIRTDRILSAADFCEVFKPGPGELFTNKPKD